MTTIAELKETRCYARSALHDTMEEVVAGCVESLRRYGVSHARCCSWSIRETPAHALAAAALLSASMNDPRQPPTTARFDTRPCAVCV